MYKNHVLLLIAVLLVVLTGCPGGIDHRQELIDTREAVGEAIAGGDTERIFSSWSEDVVIYPVSEPAVKGIIGMCVFDFIWWSFPNEEMRNEFTNHISQVPSIWKPFMVIGPSSKRFNLRLLILSLNYIKRGKPGLILVFVANLILWHIISLPFRLILGYTITLIGFSIIYLEKTIKTCYNKVYAIMLPKRSHYAYTHRCS
jgi:hypothetical protein